MLTVIHISAGDLDTPGGIREVIRHLTPAQRSMGLRPVVVGLCRNVAKTGVPLDIDQHWVYPTGIKQLDRYRLFRRAMSVIQRSSVPVIVHAHELRASGEMAIKIRSKLRTRFLVTVHIDPAHRHSQQAGAAMERRNVRARVAKTADGLVGVSDFIRNKVEMLAAHSESPRQIRSTVYPAVAVPDLEHFARPHGMDRPYVLALGRLADVKGFDSLIRAWAKTSLPGRWHLVIAGSGPEEANLRRIAQEQNVGASVLFAGRVEGDSKWALVKHAELLAVTTHKIEEAFCLSALEAVHCMTPVVGYCGGGLQEIVANGINGVLVAPGDETALAREMERLAGDESLRRQFSDNCRDIRGRFTIEAAAENYLHLYRKILGCQP